MALYVDVTDALPLFLTDQRVESRLHLKKEPTGLMDVEGQLFFKVTGGVDWEVKGHIKEDRGNIYSVSCQHSLAFTPIHKNLLS